MKYTIFARIRGLVIAAICTLLGFGLWTGCRQSRQSVPPTPTDVTQATTVTPQTQATTASAYPDGPTGTKPIGTGKPSKPLVSDTAAFSDVHREILKMQKEPLSKGEDKGDSLRWIVSDAGIKAEFRSDKSKGSTTWNRVKIDYNNNKHYEEKWDFKTDGSIKRQVAPNDDDNYTEEYKLQGDKWVRK